MKPNTSDASNGVNTFDLEIVTPEEIAFRGKAYSLIVPSYEGYLGVMAGHAPFICALKEGIITIRQEVSQENPSKKDVSFRLSSGFMETTSSKTTILADKIRHNEQ